MDGSDLLLLVWSLHALTFVWAHCEHSLLECVIKPFFFIILYSSISYYIYRSFVHSSLKEMLPKFMFWASHPLTLNALCLLYVAHLSVGNLSFLSFSSLLSLRSPFFNHSPPCLHQDQGSRLWVEGVGCVGRAVGASAGLLSRQGGTGWQPGGKALLKIHCWESDWASPWSKPRTHTSTHTGQGGDG